MLLFEMTINLDIHGCNVSGGVSPHSQFLHSPGSEAAARLLHPPSKRVHSAVGICRRPSTGATPGSPGVWVTSHWKAVDKQPRPLSLPLPVTVSLSLLHSGCTTSQGMFQHATNSRPGCMSLLLDHRGRSRESERGETQKRPSMTQPASVT